MSKTIIGIDTGLEGAIAILPPIERNLAPMVLPTPTIEIKKAGKTKKGNDKTKTDYLINDIVDILKPFAGRNDVLVVLEKSGMRPGQSAQAGFYMGRGFGIMEGIMAALSLPVITPLPQQWQKAMIPGQAGETKARSISVARKLFPNVNFKASERCTNYHDGMTDAILLAEWGRRQDSNDTSSIPLADPVVEKPIKRSKLCL